jgi:hypothetical protein
VSNKFLFVGVVAFLVMFFSKVGHGFFDAVFHIYADSAVVKETDVHSQEYMVFSSGHRHLPELPSNRLNDVSHDIFVGSMCHTIEQTDRQGYPNC